MFDEGNCRVCLKKDAELIKTATVANNRSYDEELRFCVPEIDWICSYASSLICQNCIPHLEAAARFRRLCLESDTVRKKYFLWLERHEKNSLDSECTLLNSSTNSSDNEDHTETNPKEDSTDTCVKQSKKVYIPHRKDRTCTFCNCTFSKYATLANHVRSVHTFEKCFKCDLCGEGFTNAEILSRHKNRHTGERKYVCSYCGKKFFTNSDLNHHVQRHLNQRSYKCGICENKSFNTANSLRSHKLVVHTNPDEWKYLCTTCGRKCVTQAALTVHMKRHLNEKDYGCHLCPKKFCTKAELSKHISSHSNMRLHKCKICGQEYKDKKVMERHLTKKHGVGNAKIVERVKKYICNTCPKKFVGRRQLEKHLRAHTGERPFKCELCEQTFICSSYIRGHMKSKHSVEIRID